MRSSVDRERGDECAPHRAATQSRQVRTARLACCVGGRRYSVGRKACGPHVKIFERDTYDIPKPVPPTCRGVGAVKHRPTWYGGARPALRQSTTTQPRQVRTSRFVPRAPWAVGPCVTERKARGPRATGFERGVLELLKPVPSACRCVGAVEPRPTRWEERPPRWATTQPRQVCTARHVRSVRGRPIHLRVKSERAARL